MIASLQHPTDNGKTSFPLKGMTTVVGESFKRCYVNEREIIFEFGPSFLTQGQLAIIYPSGQKDIELEQETYQMPNLCYEFFIDLDCYHLEHVD